MIRIANDSKPVPEKPRPNTNPFEELVLFDSLLQETLGLKGKTRNADHVAEARLEPGHPASGCQGGSCTRRAIPLLGKVPGTLAQAWVVPGVYHHGFAPLFFCPFILRPLVTNVRSFPVVIVRSRRSSGALLHHCTRRPESAPLNHYRHSFSSPRQPKTRSASPIEVPD
jgi:hypothetical protein